MFSFRSRPKSPEQHLQLQTPTTTTTNIGNTTKNKKPKPRFFPKTTPARAIKRTHSHHHQPPPPPPTFGYNYQDAKSLDDSSLYTSQSKATIQYHYVTAGNKSFNNNQHHRGFIRDEQPSMEHSSVADSELFAELTLFKQRQRSRQFAAVVTKQAAPSLLTPVTVPDVESSPSTTRDSRNISEASYSCSSSHSYPSHPKHEDQDHEEASKSHPEPKTLPPLAPPLSRRFVFNDPDPDASAPVDLDLDSDLEDNHEDLEDYHDEDRVRDGSSRPTSTHYSFDPDTSALVDLEDLDISDLEDDVHEHIRVHDRSPQSQSQSPTRSSRPTHKLVVRYEQPRHSPNVNANAPVDCDQGPVDLDDSWIPASRQESQPQQPLRHDVQRGPVDLDASIPVDLDDSIFSSSNRSSSISSCSWGLSPISKAATHHQTIHMNNHMRHSSPSRLRSAPTIPGLAPNQSQPRARHPATTPAIPSSPLRQTMNAKSVSSATPYSTSTPKSTMRAMTRGAENTDCYIWSDMADREDEYDMSSLGNTLLLSTPPSKTLSDAASCRNSSNTFQHHHHHQRVESTDAQPYQYTTNTATTTMGTTATARFLHFPEPSLSPSSKVEQGNTVEQLSPRRQHHHQQLQQQQQPEHKHERIDLEPYQEENSGTGAVLLTDGELEKHLHKTTTIQPAPSFGMAGFEAWKVQQQEEQEYFRKLQAAHDQQKRKTKIQAQGEQQQRPFNSAGSVMTKSMASTLPTFDDPALRHTTKHNAVSPNKSYSNIEDQHAPTTTISKSPFKQSASSSPRRGWNPFRRRKEKLASPQKKTTGKGKKTETPVSGDQQFSDVSVTTESADVAASSVAPLMLMEHLTIVDGTIPEESEGVTTKRQILALRFLEQERKKQRQALYDKERDERQEQERIARLKQQALECQRQLQQELELERSKSVGIIAKKQQEQEAQVELERQRQQQEVDLLAQELAEDLRREAEAELEYQQQLQDLKDETIALKQESHAQQRPPLAARKSLTEKLKVLDVYRTSPPRTKSIFDDLVLPRRGSMSSKNSGDCSSVGPGQSSTGISVLSTGSSVLAPCVLCETGERTCISMPCMHFMFCQSCVEDLHQRDITACPVCETEQVAFVNVNLS
jgi:hypothetical protein